MHFTAVFVSLRGWLTFAAPPQMKTTTFALSLFLLACNTAPTPTNVPPTVNRQKAEFETNDALWLIWPTTDHKAGESVETVTMAMVDAMVSDLKVVICCAHDTVLQMAQNALRARYPDLKNLEFHVIPAVEIWTRDMGPVFVELSDGSCAIADFHFNSWGYADTLDSWAMTEEKFDENLAEILHLPVISSPMISEGGNREVNGKGTLMVTESVEQGRNPAMTKTQMEAEYHRLLGVTKVIWLKEGLVEDSHTFLGPIATPEGTKAYTCVTTNGHVDEFARFVNDSTILLASVDPAELTDSIAMENHRRLEENYQILSQSTDQNGRPFTILRLPLPPTMYSTLVPGDYVYEFIKTLNYRDGTNFPEGDTITVIVPASYLNFVVTNKVVLAPSYWREDMPETVRFRDAEAKRTLETAFPNRTVVMIDALPVNLGGGGLHCVSGYE
jgi:agmatine deiminase